MWWIDFICIALLGIVVYQDFKYRAISWILIPLLLTAFLSNALYSYGETIIRESIINIMIILVQLVLLSLYFSIRNQKFTNIINSYLGIGDILFMAVLCVAFSTVNMLLFYISSIILTITGYLTLLYFKKNGSKEIPLAGAMAFMIIVLMVYKQITPSFNLHQDILVIN